MNRCLLCARFPFCRENEKECKNYIKRGYEYELKKKTEQKESESFQENLMNMDITLEEDNNFQG